MKPRKFTFILFYSEKKEENELKKIRKLLFILTCLLLVQTAVLAIPRLSVEAQAATKKGLVRSGLTVRYYKGGKPITNQWKKAKDGDAAYWFYFGKDGKAYRAPKKAGFQNNITIKTINGVRYGFDMYGHRARGMYANASPRGKFYFFTSKGVYNTAKTLSYRKASKAGTDSAKLRKALGKSLKTETGETCILAPSGAMYTFVLEHYENFTVQYNVDPGTKKEVVYSVYANIAM